MKRFHAEQFKPFRDPHARIGADDKAAFANQFVRFVESGFQRHQFTKKFYQRLSLCFGFIAHFDCDGFYATYFTSSSKLVQFFSTVTTFPCYGDPEYTFSDVEKMLQAWVKEQDLLTQFKRKQEEEFEAMERATLARLKAKYEPKE